MDTPPSTPRRSRRPNFSVEFKRRVVEAPLLPGASVALIAREHEVNANLVFKWRRHYREGQLGPVAHQVTLLPVNLSKAPTPSAVRAAQSEYVKIMGEFVNICTNSPIIHVKLFGDPPGCRGRQPLRRLGYIFQKTYFNNLLFLCSHPVFPLLRSS